MGEFRLGRNTTEHYSSLEEMRSAWGLRPVNKKTSDEKKLTEQQSVFCSKHKCKACGKPMVFISNSNAMVCLNEKCKGSKNIRIDKEGNEIVTYTPSYDLLDDLGSEIAINLFG